MIQGSEAFVCHTFCPTFFCSVAPVDRLQSRFLFGSGYACLFPNRPGFLVPSDLFS